MALLDSHSSLLTYSIPPTPTRDAFLLHANSIRPHGIICFVSDTKIDKELLDAAGDQVKIISTVSVGYDHVDTLTLKSRGIKLANTPGVVAAPTAEIALALALMATRRIKDAMTAVYGRIGPAESSNESNNNGGGELFSSWSPRSAYGLRNKIIGIIGLGAIGVQTALRLRAFGVNPTILYTGSSSPKPAAEAETNGPCQFLPLSDLLQRSDIVFVTCSLNAKTKGLIGTEQFQNCKPTAALINVARGPIVNTDALVDALQTGKIAAAGLDVTDPEPLPQGHPLLGMRNVVVLPHMGTDSGEAMDEMAMMAVENMVRGLQGKEMLAEVAL